MDSTDAYITRRKVLAWRAHDKDMEVTYVPTGQVEPLHGNCGIHTPVWMKNMDHDKYIRKVFNLNGCYS
jgi:hypothetical protein